jgi:hypothetical protein
MYIVDIFILNCSVFLVITRRMMVSNRRFGTTYLSIFKGQAVQEEGQLDP